MYFIIIDPALTSYITKNNLLFQPGMRLAPIGDFCTPSNGLSKDGLDNDCDDRIDEELLNGIDDDGDGLIGKTMHDYESN